MPERASGGGGGGGSRLWPHVWTLLPRLSHALRPVPAPPGEPWGTVVEDPVVGPVRLTGRLHRGAASGGLVILVHGLGGTCDSHYILRGAVAADDAGLSCLRLNLRGADHSGEDFYHAGLTADLHAALASPDLRRFERVYLLGYSLGGHLALRYASEPGDARLVRVAAVCAPLDLGLSQREIDRPGGWLYRRYLLKNLAGLYAAIAARRPMPLPPAEAARLRRLRDFDELVVAPRHGFSGAEDYYARASVAPRLGALRVPSLLVNSAGDPMVRARAVRPFLEAPVPGLAVRWVADGGHVGFPSGVDLGLGGEGPVRRNRRRGGGVGESAAGAAPRRPRVDDQVVAWLLHG
jgi:predicted alpha/beta-fold hydrolase